ncbi:MAG: ribonuclease P protein component [Rhodospirillaceae bacterium]|nr:ribonuclease P protein component [Rhodospirillaceae bacterium]|tara:strand:+ start:386 stop:751 length:366 start_codon:yes stop_codon:yes gene_type:complete
MLSGAPFTRKQRLTQSMEYSRVFSKAIRSTDRYFTVLARNGVCDNSRLGLAISKKIDKRAVARNKLKRLCREVFRQKDLASLDCIVMAKRDAVGVANKTLIKSLHKHFCRVLSQARKQNSG